MSIDSRRSDGAGSLFSRLRICLASSSVSIDVGLQNPVIVMMMFTEKKSQQEGVTKFNPTQKCRPAKGIREST
jgi:hypothetical protein